MWVKTFACRLKTKLIMWENLTRKLSLDFQENISEVRKLPLSFHFAAENWSKMAILVELWQKLALYWLYWQLFSGKAKRKKKKKWVSRNSNQKKIQARNFLENNCYESHSTCTGHDPPVRGVKFAENSLFQVSRKQISVLPVLSQDQIHAHLQCLLLAS